MPTIAENLQTLVNQKAAIKTALENQGKEPTDSLGSYAGLIDGLENPDNVVYFVTADDGETETFANLHGKEKVELTATENDVRVGTSVISKHGYMEGTKDIPGYVTSQGFISIKPNCNMEIGLSDDKYDYTKLQAMIMPYNSSISNSVAVDKVVIDDKVYNANSTEVVSIVSKDATNKSISLGITNGDNIVVIRYFTYKEVP